MRFIMILWKRFFLSFWKNGSELVPSISAALFYSRKSVVYNLKVYIYFEWGLAVPCGDYTYVCKWKWEPYWVCRKRHLSVLVKALIWQGIQCRPLVHFFRLHSEWPEVEEEEEGTKHSPLPPRIQLVCLFWPRLPIKSLIMVFIYSPIRKHGHVLIFRRLTRFLAVQEIFVRWRARDDASLGCHSVGGRETERANDSSMSRHFNGTI